MKTPETNQKHSPFGRPSSPALFLALIKPKMPSYNYKKQPNMPTSHYKVLYLCISVT